MAHPTNLRCERQRERQGQAQRQPEQVSERQRLEWRQRASDLLSETKSVSPLLLWRSFLLQCFF